MNELSPIIEAAVLRQSEETLRDLIGAFRNVGLTQAQIAFMLRVIAEELAPEIVLHEQPRVMQ